MGPPYVLAIIVSFGGAAGVVVIVIFSFDT